MHRMGMALLLATLTGCATTFFGSSPVRDGPAGCRAVCDGWDMDLAGMVKMGEYSDGCICQVKAKPAAAAPSDGSPAAAAIPAAAGVYMQMAAAAAAQREAMSRSQGTSAHPYVPGSPTGTPGWRPGLP